MSEQPRQLPPPSNPALPPVLAAVTWAAAVVASSGIISLLTDRDVIDYPDAGPLLGVVMVVAAGVLTWLGCWRSARASAPWLPALLTALGAFAAFVVVGGVGYGLIRGSAAWMLLAAAHFALSPFVVAAAVLAFLAAVGTWALSRARR
ncbi:DUF6121 family protein [Salinibacterium soli]|uniref:DUF6121 family protein n=1 Tax=Antiquaquibacter soli TaxID=3064523 RepID=A0ABT9BP97_9MICO|nr:DUF6121 family protein [Protaetiibacter sp. WY-16]MDO7882856.1 DUF6121 family protein [Protaetiibacter sp. WY-16]